MIVCVCKNNVNHNKGVYSTTQIYSGFNPKGRYFDVLLLLSKSKKLRCTLWLSWLEKPL